MHEMAVADAVLQLALTHAAGRRVTHVQVQVGHLRQVVPSALSFSWEVVTMGTAADGAALGVEAVPAIGRCRACAVESRLQSFPLRCGACGGLDLEIVSGEELLVDWLELEEPDEAELMEAGATDRA